MTVALDIDPSKAHPWIDAAQPTHPSLVDTTMVTNELLGFTNVPMAVWIDEEGMLVRPAELASIEVSPLRDAAIPDDLDDRIKMMLQQIKKFPGDPEGYLAAIHDWVDQGAASRFALAPDEVVARSAPRDADKARAVACFELGQELFRREGQDAAVPWWREAHRLDRGNWAFKRQAWTLVTTAEGQPPRPHPGAERRVRGQLAGRRARPRRGELLPPAQPLTAFRPPNPGERVVRPLVVAHRACPRHAPENSLAGIAAAGSWGPTWSSSTSA